MKKTIIVLMIISVLLYACGGPTTTTQITTTQEITTTIAPTSTLISEDIAPDLNEIDTINTELNTDELDALGNDLESLDW